MSLTLNTTYPTAVNASLNACLLAPILDLWGRAIDIPDGAQQGVVTVNIITAFTAGTIADGTMLTNGLNNTTASMTLAAKQATVSLTPTQLRNILVNGTSLGRIAKAAADSLVFYAQDAAIEGLIATTPSSSNTLTTGRANFKNGAQYDISLAAKMITDVAVNRNGDLSEIFCPFHPTAYAYFIAACGTILNNPVTLGQTGMNSFMGVPFFPIPANSATTWGAASNTCCFAVHPEGYALKLGGPYLHGGGPIYASDGTVKLITVLPVVYGAIQAGLTGECKNGAS